VNWLGEEPLETAAELGIGVHARIRSSQPPRPATLALETDGSIMVLLHDGEDGVASGQACVLYADGSAEARVLGGGWIARTVKTNETTPAEAARAEPARARRSSDATLPLHAPGGGTR
jgi:tRNA-specific 2-thiouridylase